MATGYYFSTTPTGDASYWYDEYVKKSAASYEKYKRVVECMKEERERELAYEDEEI